MFPVAQWSENNILSFIWLRFVYPKSAQIFILDIKHINDKHPVLDYLFLLTLGLKCGYCLCLAVVLIRLKDELGDSVNRGGKSTHVLS